MRASACSGIVLALSLGGIFLVACEGPQGPAGPGAPDGGPGDGDGGLPAGAGLALTLRDAVIAGDGTASVEVELDDGSGVPLDRNGASTEGAVEVTFVIAHLGRDGNGMATQYESYTTRVQTAEDGTMAVQAAGESDGTWERLGAGRYRYTFATSVDVADPMETHTVGAWAEREVGDVTYTDDATFDFVPAGGDVAYRRQIVADEQCEGCHVRLAFHGGARRSIALCILCHSPQTTDPDTGNTVDFKVMVHKIHRGRALPSVMAGTPYQIVGYMGSVHDYSTVSFPTPNTVSNCADCHAGDEWKTNFSQATCTSCHDRTWFGVPDEVPVGWNVHGGGPQPNSNCDVCHSADLPGLPPTSVVNAHRVGLFAPDRPEPQVAITSVSNTGPGQTPTITFTVAMHDEPRDILAEPLSTLRATFAGPNTDYARFWQATIQGTGAGGTLVAGAAPGEFVWTAPASAAIPPDATGSYTVALEASMLDANAVRIPAMAPLVAVAVTDAEATRRRAIVAQENCDRCHQRLSFHGGNRANVQYCAMCHNPKNVNDERASRVEGQQVYVHSVQLTSMIHRIHMGEELTQPYVLFGFPAPTVANPAGTPEDFREVRYPAPRTMCVECHTDETYRLTPSADGRLSIFEQTFSCGEDPAADDDLFCEEGFAPSATFELGPWTAACTGCHDAPSVTAHAMVMTADNGVESCATCHGPGADFEAHGAQ